MDEITKANAELLPSLELPNLPDAMAVLEQEKAKLPALQARAAAIVCDSRDNYVKLVEAVDAMEKVGKTGEEQMRPLLDVVNDVSKYLHGKRKEIESAATLAVKTHKDRASEWARQERERAEREEREENARRARMAAEAAEAQRKADEAAAIERRKERVAEIRRLLKSGKIKVRESERLLREAGATEEADKAKAAADAEQVKTNVQTVSVVPSIPKVAGRRGGRQYFAQVTNFGALLAGYVETFLPPPKGKQFTFQEQSAISERRAYLRRFIIADEQELGKEARDVEDSAKLNATIPGVLFTDRDRV